MSSLISKRSNIPPVSLLLRLLYNFGIYFSSNIRTDTRRPFRTLFGPARYAYDKSAQGCEELPTMPLRNSKSRAAENQSIRCGPIKCKSLVRCFREVKFEPLPTPPLSNSISIATTQLGCSLLCELISS